MTSKLKRRFGIARDVVVIVGLMGACTFGPYYGAQWLGGMHVSIVNPFKVEPPDPCAELMVKQARLKAKTEYVLGLRRQTDGAIVPFELDRGMWDDVGELAETEQRMKLEGCQ